MSADGWSIVVSAIGAGATAVGLTLAWLLLRKIVNATEAERAARLATVQELLGNSVLADLSAVPGLTHEIIAFVESSRLESALLKLTDLRLRLVSVRTALEADSAHSAEVERMREQVTVVATLDRIVDSAARGQEELDLGEARNMLTGVAELARELETTGRLRIGGTDANSR
ncbi:MAG: hypothetical protein F4Z25_11430 [Chloroflexi bacterium]|nr:hypothetical protein [Chloroflexota bacterium]